MRPRLPRTARLRRVAKRAGAAACVMLVAAWCCSVFFAHVWIERRTAQGGWLAGASGGCFSLLSSLPPDKTGWEFGSEPIDTSHVVWWYGWRVPGALFRSTWIPLWMPFTLIALPTAWLFWSDHRRPRAGQ